MKSTRQLSARRACALPHRPLTPFPTAPRLLPLTLLLCAGLLLAAPPASAAVKNWSGTTSGYWGTASNWSGGVAPVNGDDLVFPAVARLVNTNNFGNLKVNSITFTAGAYTLRGNALTVTNGISSQQASGANIVEFDVTLGAAQTIDCTTAGSSLYLEGNLTNGGFTLTGSGSGTVGLDGSISGSGGVIKNGTGTLSYGGGTANTYSGATVVNSGTLLLTKTLGNGSIVAGTLTIGDDSGAADSAVVRLATNSQLGTTPDIIINADGLLDLNDISEIIGNSLTLNDGEIQTGTGLLTLSASPSITVSGYPSVSGRLSVGSGTCTIQGSGSLYLHANVSGSANIVKDGNVAVWLYGTNTFTGTLTANYGGYLYALSDLALGATNGGTIINDSAYLALYNASITNETLTMNTSDSYAIDSVGNVTNIWSGPVSLSRDTIVYVVTNGVLEIIGSITGTGGLTKEGPGTLIFSGSSANTYGGATTVNEGQLDLNKNDSVAAIPLAGLVIGDGIGTDTVRHLNDNQLWYIGKAVKINSSGVLNLNGFKDTASPLTLDGGRITTGAGTVWLAGTVTLLTNAGINATIDGKAYLYNPVVITNAGHHGTYDLIINASISSDTGDGITKTGAGVVSLTAANTFTGPLTVNAGELVFWNSGGLGDTNAPAIVNSGGTLHVAGNLAIGPKPLVLNGSGWSAGTFPGALAASDGASSWAGPITNASDSTILVWPGRSLDLAGPISGPGGVTKTYAGTLTFSGSSSNTYAGTTYVSSGTLLLNKPAVVDGTIPHDLVIEGTVRNLDTYQIPNNVTVTIGSSGVLDLTAGGEGIGGLNGSGSVNVGTNYLSCFGSNSYSYNGIISGTGNFNAAGPGTYTLNGDNTYTGLTLANKGTLLVNGNQPQSRVQVDSTGTLGGSGTVGSILANGNIAPGSSAGCLTSSNLTFSGTGDYYVELNGTSPCTGYDQMVVRGTNNLANAILHVSPAFPPGDPVSLADRFVIINNDGAETVTGTFSGLPDGAEFDVGAYRFRINYANEVTLTAVGLPLSGAATAVSTGNGNHAVDPNECNFLDLLLTNTTGSPMSGVAAVLSTTHARAVITQPYSSYPDIPNGQRRTNATPFQVSTLTSFSCGDEIPLQLAVTTTTHGSFVVPLRLASGSPASSASRYDNNTTLSLPDTGTVESTNTVAGFSGPLTKVVVSLYLTHTYDGDLDIALIAPDGTIVDLSSGNGGSGDDYGSAASPDSSRTTFDDGAATSITAGSAPFVGTFRPEGSLASLIGGTANGDWRLRITDNFGGSLGALRNWSLFLYGVTCTDGGGGCGFCLPPISGVIETSDPTQTNRWNRNGVVGSCGAPKAWVGVGASGTNYHYDVYTFTNLTGADACVTVNLQSSSDVMAALYLDSFNPSDISQNYLGDAGYSTANDAGETTFSATVPAGARFLVTVNERNQNSGTLPYTLYLSGLPCPQPTLAAEPAPANQVRVHWPTWAGGYKLEASTDLPPVAWGVVTNEPTVGGGRYNVTNNTATLKRRFYRLSQP